MALSSKYGKVDIPKVGENEPVFILILRAQDKLAEAAIEMYRVLTASHGALVAGELQQEVDRFHGWRGDKKMPD